MIDQLMSYILEYELYINIVFLGLIFYVYKEYLKQIKEDKIKTEELKKADIEKKKLEKEKMVDVALLLNNMELAKFRAGSSFFKVIGQRELNPVFKYLLFGVLLYEFEDFTDISGLQLLNDRIIVNGVVYKILTEEKEKKEAENYIKSIAL